MDFWEIVYILIGLMLTGVVAYSAHLAAECHSTTHHCANQIRSHMGTYLLTFLLTTGFLSALEWRGGFILPNAPLDWMAVVFVVGFAIASGVYLLLIYALHPEEEDRARWAHSIRPSHCGRCDYQIDGTDSTQCPECGWNIPSVPAATQPGEWRRWWKRWKIEWVDKWRSNFIIQVYCVTCGLAGVIVGIEMVAAGLQMLRSPAVLFGTTVLGCATVLTVHSGINLGRLWVHRAAHT